MTEEQIKQLIKEAFLDGVDHVYLSEDQSHIDHVVQEYVNNAFNEYKKGQNDE